MNASHSAGPPSVSVMVSTRNRAEDVLPCVRSILANEGVSFELVVVDQSDGDESRRAVEGGVSDPRLRWVSTTTRGLSISRNIAIDNARAELLLFTDDDCRVPPDWIAKTKAVFDEDPEAALIFGRVRRPEGGDDAGFAAEFEPPRESYQHEYPHVMDSWGIGASMALRRSALERVGRFDGSLGAGARFRGGEDADITIRILSAGLKVICTSRATVTHLGVRGGQDASKLMRGYGIGLGATLAKHVRLRTRGAAKLLADWLYHQGGRALTNVAKGQHPSGLGIVVFSLWGAARSCLIPVDERGRVYRER